MISCQIILKTPEFLKEKNTITVIQILLVVMAYLPDSKYIFINNQNSSKDYFEYWSLSLA